jgi:uncharacterized protein YlxW (UPF0749 family)
MKRVSNKNIVLLLVFMVLGIVLAVQLRSTLYSKNQAAAQSMSLDDLLEQIAAETNEIERIRKEIEENLTLKENYILSYIESEGSQPLPDNRLEVLSKAGLTDVKGPGITIRLDDAPARKEGTPVDWLIIHDQDIKIILNELKKAGAQAISINGERVVATSEQICAGPTILINGSRYPVPYVINAIGDPDVLFENISMSDRIAEMVEYDIRVEIAKSKEIIIPKFIGGASIDMYLTGLEVND